MVLPPGAVFEAILEDVSRADAPAHVVGRAHIDGPGNPPIPFSISYDPSRIDPSHRYAVRARIVVSGKLLFTSDQHYPVLTAGESNEVNLLLRRAGASSAASGGARMLQQRRDPTIAVAAILAGQHNDGLGERIFVVPLRRPVPLRAAWLFHHSARPALAHSMSLSRVADRTASSFRA
jgi:hypothetical protein